MSADTTVTTLILDFDGHRKTALTRKTYALRICLPPLYFQAEIAAIAAFAESFGSMPQKVFVQIIIGNVIAVTKAGAQLRTAVLCANIIVRALYHIYSPHAAACLNIV